MKTVTLVKACSHWEQERWNPTRCRHCFQPKERHDEANSSSSPSSSASSYSASPTSYTPTTSSSASKVFSTATKFGAVKSSSKSSFVPAAVNTNSSSSNVSSSQSSYRPPVSAPSTKSKPFLSKSKSAKSSFVPGLKANKPADSSSPSSSPAPWAVKLKSTGLLKRDLPPTPPPSSSSSSAPPNSNNAYAAMYSTPVSTSTTVMAPLERKPTTQNSKSNFRQLPVPGPKASSTLSRSVSNPQDERSVLQARREREEAVQREREQELQRQRQLAVTSETGYYVKMLYDFDADGQHLRSGEVVGLVNWDDPNWWFVTRNTTGLRAYVPSDYVATTDPPSAQTQSSSPRAPGLPPKPSFGGAGKGAGGGGTRSASTPAVRKAMANFDFNAVNKGEISCKSGDLVVVLDRQDPNWWFVRHNQSSQTGFIPSNYLVLADSAHDEPQRPAEAPSRVSIQHTVTQNTPQAYALYDFTGKNEGEISCKFSELFNILDRSEADWWFVERKLGGETGWLPSSYLNIVDQDTIDAYYEKKSGSHLTPQGGYSNGGYQHPGATPILQPGNQQTGPEGSNCIIS